MSFEFYMCDSPNGLLKASAALPEDAQILYQTPNFEPESGEIWKTLVVGLEIGEAAQLDEYLDKFILLARV